jgi:hypothetical protein
MNKLEYFNRPCFYCVFCIDGNCTIGIVDEENPCDMRKHELEEFGIMELHQDLNLDKKEELAATLNQCYLNVDSDEVIDAIIYWRNKSNE